MGDLLLGTRLAVLKSNLEEVQRALESVEEGSADLRKLLDLPRKADSWMTSIVDAVNKARVALEPPDPDALEALLEKLRRDALEFRDQVRELNKAAASIQTRSPPLAQSDLGKTIRDFLMVGTGEELREVAVLEKQLAAAADKVRAEPRMLMAAETQNLWSAFETRLLSDSQEVFAEYVDLLGGLALRASGFDRGICSIADQLVRSCIKFPEFKWNSLTIPALREAVGMTVARIIRLGFPEWTIWALPLAAHELGHVLVRKVDQMSDFAEERKPGEPHINLFLADAFATSVIGPAYACAAILMRFDPWKAFTEEDDRVRPRRVAVILGMLARMSAAAGGSDPYRAIVEGLESEWDAALEQTGASGSLTAEEKQAIGEWLEFMNDLMVITGRALDVATWDRIVPWSELLAAGKEIELGDGDEVGYVLNAAWLARIQHPGRAKRIAEAAEHAWHQKELRRVGQEPRPDWNRPQRQRLSPPLGGAEAGPQDRDT